MLSIQAILSLYIILIILQREEIHRKSSSSPNQISVISSQDFEISEIQLKIIMAGGSFSSTNTYFESGININGGRRCAACKYLRRRCSEDCILAPYFHHSQPDRFAFVHKVFGASNVARMLQQLPAHERAQAADAIATEAHWRVQNPIYGCTDIIARLQHQVTNAQNELALIKAQIAIHKGHLQPRAQAQSHNVVDKAHWYLKSNDFLLPELPNLPPDFC